jgi:hypothetical protein
MIMEANAPAGEVLPVTIFQLNQKKPANTLKEGQGEISQGYVESIMDPLVIWNKLTRQIIIKRRSTHDLHAD